MTFNSETQLFDVHDGQHIVDSKFLTAAFRNKIFPSLEQYSAIRDGDYSNSIKGRKRRLSLDPEPLVYSSPKRRLHRAAISSVMPLNITDTPARQLRSLALGSPSTDSPVPPQNAEKSNLDEHPTRDHQGSGVDLQVWPSKRFQRAMELLNTERNYAKVLRGLLDKVKPVLEGTNGPGTVLMSESQVNLVFGNLVQICRYGWWNCFVFIFRQVRTFIKSVQTDHKLSLEQVIGLTYPVLVPLRWFRVFPNRGYSVFVSWAKCPVVKDCFGVC